jgi:hypothetical protein
VRIVLSDTRDGALLLSPLFGGLALHGLCIRFGWGAGLAVPSDRGRTLRGRRLFLGSFLFVYLGHQLLTAAGYCLGMRTTWR